jgi:gas vesicle protein
METKLERKCLNCSPETCDLFAKCEDRVKPSLQERQQAIDEESKQLRKDLKDLTEGWRD